MQHFHKVKKIRSEKLKEKLEVTVMQMEVGDALAESRVFKAPTSRIGVGEQQKWCWKWRSSETAHEGRMRRVVSSCDI